MSGTDSAHYVLKHKSAITADFQGDYLPVGDLEASGVLRVEMYVSLRNDEPSGLCDCTGPGRPPGTEANRPDGQIP